MTATSRSVQSFLQHGYSDFLIVGPGTCVHNVRIRLKNKILNRNKHKKRPRNVLFESAFQKARVITAYTYIQLHKYGNAYKRFSYTQQYTTKQNLAQKQTMWYTYYTPPPPGGNEE